MLLSEVIEEFVHSMKVDNWSNAHVRRRYSGLKNLLRYVGNPDITTLTKRTIETAYAELKKLDGTTYSDASKMGFRESWRAFFDWAHRKSITQLSGQDLKLKRFKYTSNRDKTVPDHIMEKIDNGLLAYANTFARTRDALMISLTADSGGRIGEVHQITKKEMLRALKRPFRDWHDTDEGQTMVPTWEVLTGGKTDGIALTFSETSALLAKQYFDLLPPKLARKSPYLFINALTGRHLKNNGSMQTCFKYFFEWLKIPIYYPHAFRHSKVTRLDDQGTNGSVISSITGHKSQDMINQHYLNKKYKKARKANGRDFLLRKINAKSAALTQSFFDQIKDPPSTF